VTPVTVSAANVLLGCAVVAPARKRFGPVTGSREFILMWRWVVAIVETIHAYSKAVHEYPDDILGQQEHFSGFIPAIGVNLGTELQDEFDMSELEDLYSFLSILMDGGAA
jgi:hypothetical protein